MFVAALTTILLFPGSQHSTPPPEWSSKKEVPDYQAAFVPQSIRNLKPQSVSFQPGSVRGYRPIVSYWVIKKPFVEVASKSLMEMTPDQGLANMSDRDLKLRGSVNGQKTMGDRVVQVWIQKGRPVVKRDKNMTSYAYADEDTYTRVRMVERPLLYGKMPKAWPKVAMRAPQLPKNFPGQPFKGQNIMLTRWTTDKTPVGATQYWIDWYVPESFQTLSPKLLAQLKNQSTWKSPTSTSGQSIRIEPVKNGSNFVWMGIESGGGTFEELPANVWTRITISWCDPTTGLRGKSMRAGN